MRRIWSTIPIEVFWLIFVVGLSTVLDMISWNGSSGDVFRTTIAFLAAVWVKKDAQKRGIYFPSDWVFIFTIFYYPLYVFQSRGLKGVYPILIMIVIVTVPDLIKVFVISQNI